MNAEARHVWGLTEPPSPVQNAPSNFLNKRSSGADVAIINYLTEFIIIILFAYHLFITKEELVALKRAVLCAASELLGARVLGDGPGARVLGELSGQQQADCRLHFAAPGVCDDVVDERRQGRHRGHELRVARSPPGRARSTQNGSFQSRQLLLERTDARARQIINEHNDDNKCCETPETMGISNLSPPPMNQRL
jgi:hypothetical protein